MTLEFLSLNVQQNKDSTIRLHFISNASEVEWMYSMEISCTSRQDICHCLVVQTPMDNNITSNESKLLCDVILESMPRKLGNNRACSRVLLPSCRAFSEGIRCWKCMYGIKLLCNIMTPTGDAVAYIGMMEF